ncbi:MAG: hypothetical protein DME04_23200 [Candidatus Rokuibacteriota bacterium]|nr:MAG: hypothetical protein DME04_23200 [Candidatus Rokubacteria bacterium]
MAETKRTLESLVSVRLMRLNATVQGVVVGLIAGLGIFIATNWLIIKGGPVVGPHLALLGQFFIGYRVTFVGSLIGFAYGFVLGFCVGYGVARAYNWLADLRQRHGWTR